MKKSFVALILMLSFSGSVFSQSSLDSTLRKHKKYFARHTIYTEFSRNIILRSSNYDLMVVHKKWFSLSARLGIGFFPIDNVVLDLPTEINLLLGNQHYLEAGLGLISEFNIPPPSNYPLYIPIQSLRLGYRFQKNTGGFFLRFG